MDTNSYKEALFVRKLIHRVIHPIVISVRSELAKRFDVLDPDSEYYEYAGLCDAATEMFKERFLNRCKELNIPQFYIHLIHGEQVHSPKILRKYWVYQHSMCRIQLPTGRSIYVDPTSEQFRFIYGDNHPDYYIGIRKPEWFYPDEDNVQFNRFGHWVSSHVVFDKGTDKEWSPWYKIMDVCQYQVWGGISDHIHRTIQHIRLMKAVYHITNDPNLMEPYMQSIQSARHIIHMDQ